MWAVLAAGLMGYAQTLAFTEDEGFHLLAAQLIKAACALTWISAFPRRR